VNVLILVLATLRPKESVKYLQGTNISQLLLAERTEINNLGREITDLVISQASSSRIQTYVGKFNPAIFSKHRSFSGCAERKALLGLLINHIIILAPAQP
jgi:hypothetical protein